MIVFKLKIIPFCVILIFILCVLDEPIIKVFYFKYCTLISYIIPEKRSDEGQFSYHLTNYFKFILSEKKQKRDIV